MLGIKLRLRSGKYCQQFRLGLFPNAAYIFFLMSPVLLMLTVFLLRTLLVPPSTVGEFLKVFSASPLPPYSSTLRILWSRLSRGAWLASEDAHRLPSSTNSPWTTWAGDLIRLSSVSQLLHMFGWLCCTVAQPGVARIQQYDVSATADFMIFSLTPRRLINRLRGEATQPFILAYLCEIKKKKKSKAHTSVSPHKPTFSLKPFLLIIPNSCSRLRQFCRGKIARARKAG